MFESLGRFLYRRRRRVLVAAGLFVAVAAVWGTGVFGALSGAGFETPGSETSRAAARTEQAFGRHETDVVALYSSPTMTVDDPAFRAAVRGALSRLPAEYVAGAVTYWDTGAPSLVSADRHATYAAVQLAGGGEGARDDAYTAVKDRFAAPGLTVRLGGPAAVNHDINAQVSRDIGRAESLSMPLLLILLLVVFGSLVAAGTPLLVGGLAILGAFTALRLITLVTGVSVFAINIVTMLGLGLAIDYALFMVGRFREELERQPGVEAALARTVATAGRTVAFSGLTVAISLGGLLLFPQMFLRSMGFGGIAAVLIAMLAALTVLPAMLAALGTRVNALRFRWPRRRATGPAPGDATGPASGDATGPASGDATRPASGDATRDAARDAAGPWYRVARSVMRRPVLYVAGIVVVLISLGLPFRHVVFGGVDARALPTGTESRVVSETLDRDFVRNATTPIDVVVSGAAPAEVTRYVKRLDALPGVTRAEVVGTARGTARIAVHHAADPISEQARDLVGAVRSAPSPAGAEVLVGGATAWQVDLLDSLGRTLPWTALFVGLVTLVLLFLAFGSLVLPVKAVLMNLLSLSASFGALVWIFQDGHLSGVLGFTPTGTVEATQPILMLAIAFGLSMDYEVFLLSRVREQWDLTGDNTGAVATGLQRTGRIITSAALLLVVVIGAFSTSGITFIKMIGVGMIIAILIDATVVRALLVPATMRLLGRYNWWAPGPLARFWERYGHREVAPPPPPPAAPAHPEPVQVG